MATVTYAKKGVKKTEDTGFCGVKQIGNSVVFGAYCPDASIVQVAGDFNNWQPQQSTMKKTAKKGFYQIELKLSPGRHCYRLVVDGRWQQDPCNNDTEPNPYGGFNSVVTVK